MITLWAILLGITAVFIWKVRKMRPQEEAEGVGAVAAGVDMKRALICPDCDYLFEAPLRDDISCPRCTNRRGILPASQLFGSMEGDSNSRKPWADYQSRGKEES